LSALSAAHAGAKGGSRYVVLATSNGRKVEEYARLLARYGLVVRRGEPALWDDDDGMRRLLTTDAKCVAVLRDTAALLAADGSPASLTAVGLAYSKVVLEAAMLKPEYVRARYEATTAGFVDPGLPAPAEPFGWDHVFVVWGTGRSYEAAKGGGSGKISSRDGALSGFIRDRLHYASRKDLAHWPLKPHATIEFGLDPADFVAANPYFAAGAGCLYGAALTRVLNQGIVFRSPANRREVNYWLPGLNAGLPLVAKRDPCHEATFMAHDFGHFLQPDLVFTGSDFDVSPAGRRIYVAYRMISEAVTMMLADVLLVHHLATCGAFDYDWTARRIYPLFAATHADLPAAGGDAALATLEAVVRANVAYCLRGDDAPWRALFTDAAAGAAALAAFKEKYTPFFIVDYAWTASNIASCAARRDYFAAWWADVAPLRRLAPDLLLLTIEEFAEAAGLSGGRADAPGVDIVSAVFDTVWRLIYRPALATRERLASADHRLFHAYLRYAMGQAGLFHAPPAAASRRTAPVAAAIKTFLTTASAATAADGSRGATTFTDVAAVQALYGHYVRSLEGDGALTPDDAEVYKEVFPLFEPNYLSYDDAPASYGSLPAVWAAVFVDAAKDA